VREMPGLPARARLAACGGWESSGGAAPRGTRYTSPVLAQPGQCSVCVGCVWAGVFLRGLCGRVVSGRHCFERLDCGGGACDRSPGRRTPRVLRGVPGAGLVQGVAVPSLGGAGGWVT
jgi:hypothetical protein